MGHHKHNPTAIAANAGKLPPKERSMSVNELERAMKKVIAARIGADLIYSVFGKGYYRC